MKRCILFVLMTSSILNILGQLNPENLDLCTKLDTKIIDNAKPINLMIGPSQIRSGYDLIYSGMKCSIILDEENRITYLLVKDSTFNCLDIKIGSIYSDIDPSKIIDEGMIPGFGYFVKLSNGWNALFFSREIIDKRSLSKNSVIATFYKECFFCEGG